ncbi:hypothetical protein, conserved in T. vivax [Trypanosoma vivax Y486]|uniref:Uncharacterized protein n=1 Tax=Trypanosoma vivax (strain Y486) TaxID=1055687 RepID=F9WLN3_TRYVY|nr:hypothetical protein, conserved in T. vivax [Trypanosoma vivax Y486]|eukprot:CCD18425.1 hypothetical protein, conserved in T. vivax [Trypanosoma vivax Y486]
MTRHARASREASTLTHQKAKGARDAVARIATATRGTQGYLEKKGRTARERHGCGEGKGSKGGKEKTKWPTTKEAPPYSANADTSAGSHNPTRSLATVAASVASETGTAKKKTEAPRRKKRNEIRQAQKRQRAEEKKENSETKNWTACRQTEAKARREKRRRLRQRGTRKLLGRRAWRTKTCNATQHNATTKIKKATSTAKRKGKDWEKKKTPKENKEKQEKAKSEGKKIQKKKEENGTKKRTNKYNKGQRLQKKKKEKDNDQTKTKGKMQVTQHQNNNQRKKNEKIQDSREIITTTI